MICWPSHHVGRTTEKFVPVRLEDALDDALANLDTLVSETGAAVVADRSDHPR